MESTDRLMTLAELSEMLGIRSTHSPAGGAVAKALPATASDATSATAGPRSKPGSKPKPIMRA